MKKTTKIIIGSLLCATSLSSFASGYDKTQLKAAYKECKSEISQGVSEEQANQQFAQCMNAKGFHLNQ